MQHSQVQSSGVCPGRPVFSMWAPPPTRSRAFRPLRARHCLPKQELPVLAPTHHQPLKCLLNQPALDLEPDLPWPFFFSFIAGDDAGSGAPIVLFFLSPERGVLRGAIYSDRTGRRISIHRFSRHIDLISCPNFQVANADRRQSA
jgi:hypothetical protein